MSFLLTYTETLEKPQILEEASVTLAYVTVKTCQICCSWLNDLKLKKPMRK